MRLGLLVLLLLAASPRAIAASCSLLPSVSLLDFGSYSALSGAKDTVGQIQILCTPDLLSDEGVSYVLSADAGTGSGGSFTPRRLASGLGGLDYNMFLDPGLTQVFGDGNGGTHTVAGSCAGNCYVLIYGRIYGGQSIRPGVYQDEILITLDF